MENENAAPVVEDGDENSSPVVHRTLHLNLEHLAYMHDNSKTANLVLGINGQPMRVAHDLASNAEFVQVLSVIPAETENPRDARRVEKIDELRSDGMLTHVSGHGMWCHREDLDTVLAELK